MNQELPTEDHKFSSFGEFYEFYLAEHSESGTRRMHFLGTSLAVLCLLTIFATGNPAWLFAALLCGYGFAWIGHAVYEKNAPATFRHPLWSFIGDWRMWFEMLTGKVSF